MFFVWGVPTRDSDGDNHSVGPLCKVIYGFFWIYPNTPSPWGTDGTISHLVGGERCYTEWKTIPITLQCSRRTCFTFLSLLFPRRGLPWVPRLPVPCRITNREDMNEKKKKQKLRIWHKRHIIEFIRRLKGFLSGNCIWNQILSNLYWILLLASLVGLQNSKPSTYNWPNDLQCAWFF